ncbi:phenylalanine--tRNA ligase subunit alpha [bacterium]|nr:phenylalanine--tRNA ligase subunit alpha [bacterium]
METEKLWQQFKKKLAEVGDFEELEKLRVEFLGRKGKINQLFQKVTSLPPEKRKEFGQEVNRLKGKIQKAFLSRERKIKASLERNLTGKKIDISLPGKEVSLGHIHPITQMKWEVADIFQRMGFEVLEPQEVTTDYDNFTALNIPPDHPARDMWDTFWTKEGYIPITHTSSMQNWIYRHRHPPIRAVVIGRCFRNEATDMGHEHTFHQIEGVYVDKGITVANLIETMRVFFSEFFGKELRAKVRPSYFPFVEPGLELAIECVLCGGKGCSVCKQSGWLEILGCGQIHPRVLEEGGIDSKKYTGFAWGMGLERMIMLRMGIEDIRHFHSGDLRFIRKF